MVDITIIFYTCNIIPEKFAGNIREHLLKTAQDIPIISISHKPLDFGENICVGDIGMSVPSLYRQILAGAKKAKTPYIAMCEDDILYSRDHFFKRRPKHNFAYNLNKWSIFSWHKNPLFSFKVRTVIAQCICRTNLMIEALEERLGTDIPPERLHYLVEPGRYEARLGLTPRKRETFYSDEPNIVIEHLYGLSGINQGSYKRMGPVRAESIPNWGSPSQILLQYMGGESWLEMQGKGKTINYKEMYRGRKNGNQKVA